MKLSPYVKSVRKALRNNMITPFDVINLYKDNYLSEKECQQVLKGGKNGRIR